MNQQSIMDLVRKVFRERNYTYNTQRIYLRWIKKFLEFHSQPTQASIRDEKIDHFLYDLDSNKELSASTKNQALQALSLLFKEILQIPMVPAADHSCEFQKKLPVTFHCDEIKRVLSNLYGEEKLMASLLYGSGLRLRECLTLRYKSIDFRNQSIKVYQNNQKIKRVTILPFKLKDCLERQLKKVRIRWEENKSVPAFSGTTFPEWDEREPSISTDLNWQYLFPAQKLAFQPDHTLKEEHYSAHKLQRAVKKAIKLAGIQKQGSCSTLCHSFAAHLLENGYDIHYVQELLGHKNIKSTMVYLQVLSNHSPHITSPLDSIREVPVQVS